MGWAEYVSGAEWRDRRTTSGAGGKARLAGSVAVLWQREQHQQHQQNQQQTTPAPEHPEVEGSKGGNDGHGGAFPREWQAMAVKGGGC